ncbi:hypothetical protein [Roseateles amylovorans]|uniref:Uncharacterized protein n=1 Tax=Roseateles amylovorans TaxID=2978473 RepID=A0ABY6AZG6_9BURK|nr:hypothetical protein [Roseateles amylovorans]UXH77134.1 hypothetical protein N4261_19260 [Roseateles amylovorans]
MKPILPVALLAVAVGLMAVDLQDAVAQASYSLKAVESQPIPRAEHFALWKEVALKACADSQGRFNLGEAECRRVISQRGDACAVTLKDQSPAVISSTAVARDIGRKYMHCATPFYFCKGVEVKTEEEVRAKCK